jgi:hypothetical protein
MFAVTARPQQQLLLLILQLFIAITLIIIIAVNFFMAFAPPQALLLFMLRAVLMLTSPAILYILGVCIHRLYHCEHIAATFVTAPVIFRHLLQ